MKKDRRSLTSTAMRLFLMILVAGKHVHDSDDLKCGVLELRVEKFSDYRLDCDNIRNKYPETR